MLGKRVEHPIKSRRRALIAEAGPWGGRKFLLAESEPGVCTRNHFITIVEGDEPSTTGQTLMMVWVTSTQSIMPKIKKRVVTEKASILGEI